MKAVLPLRKLFDSFPAALEFPVCSGAETMASGQQTDARGPPISLREACNKVLTPRISSLFVSLRDMPVVVLGHRPSQLGLTHSKSHGEKIEAIPQR
ncbi:unnamed protein product [Caenorhabditis auriculariae]|uniref:Uncharacterized protein n=1 Tax=Caenorhabditis auriculariae TaxID=2777116 RepID=A0A8S1GTT5_9PELO|nr:unnamed protein product [Caenorhabditis auriculariae]